MGKNNVNANLKTDLKKQINRIWVLILCLGGISSHAIAGTVQGGSVAGSASCHSNDPNYLCLAVKYVVYRDSEGKEVVSQDDVLHNIWGIDRIWAQCKLGFQLENYLAVHPENYGLRYHPANNSELTQIRQSFEDSNTLLVVTTGTWNRHGSLGDTGANAWTSMPGEVPYGAVLERPVGLFPNIIAHELGHYLNLIHIGDPHDLMDAIIYDHSTHLTDEQCTAARAAATSYWQSTLR